MSPVLEVVVLPVPDIFGCGKQSSRKRISLVVFLNRAARVLKPTRVRLHSAVAGAAFAVIAGLSAPAAAAAVGTHAPDATSATTSHTVAAVTQTSPTPPAAATAVAAHPAAPAGPSAQDLHPVPVSADQQSLNPSAEQIGNAK